MKTCRFLTFLASYWIERPDRMPAWLRGHLDRCELCGRTFQAEADVARRLAVAPLPAAERLPAVLERRILARALSERPASGQPARIRVRWAVSIVTIVVCAAALALLMPPRGQEMAVWSDPDERDAAATAAFTLPTSAALERAAARELLRWGQSVHEPLELEWARAVEDGHRLLAAVVQSCVPDPAADALLSRTRQLLPDSETRKR